jgi:hypothetical protein
MDVRPLRRAFQVLLELGADPRLGDFEGRRPLDYLGKVSDGGRWFDIMAEDAVEFKRCRGLLMVSDE